MFDASTSLSDVRMAASQVLVEGVAARAAEWVGLPSDAKLALLEQLLQRLDEMAEEWTAAAAAIHGGDEAAADPSFRGPAWMAAAVPTASYLHGLIRSYRGLVSDGQIPAPPAFRTRDNGQRVAIVSPAGWKDRGFAPGTRGEIWLGPGQRGSQGATLREARPSVCLILGAGNYEAPLDVLSRLFAHGQVVIYKPNPVNEAHLPVLERILEPLITAGYLAIAPSGTESAQQLIHHPKVDQVFMTGSRETYDRIVWGAPDEQAARKAAGRKRMDKPFEAELGGVSPAIVVPGEWTDAELDHQAAQLAAAKMLNGGHICSSLQVIVVSAGWPQRERFLQRVRDHLRGEARMRSYYPRTAERQDAFIENCSRVELIGSAAPADDVPDVVFVPDGRADDFALRNEAFGPVLAVATLEAADPAVFLRQATRFCNEELYGSLSASLIVDPRTEKQLGIAVDDAVAVLRYGSIGVNTWGGMLFFQGDLSWGAHPGHTPEDIGSGIGLLNNGYLLDGVQKAVLWTPFVSPIHPQPRRPADAVIYPRMGRYTLRPSVGNLAKLLVGVVTGR